MLKISLAELTGNAFALYLDRTGKRNLTVKQVENFGHTTIQCLQNNSIEAYLSDSFDKFAQSIANYPEWFSYTEYNSSIILHDGITVDNLYDEFSGDMSPYVMFAFADDEIFKFLLE